MRLLLDTHIWVWYLMGASDLREDELEAMTAPDNQVFLSPVSIWETLMLAEKGRLVLGPSPEEWVRQALASYPTVEAPLTTEIAITSGSVDLPHPDPADRFLAATAKVYEAKLVTHDRRLLESGVDTF